MCLRGVCVADIVFLIYVYQRYIYPVDKSRVNEYGTSQEMLEGDAPTDAPPDALPLEGAPAIAAPASAASASSPELNGASPSPPKPKTHSKQKNKKAKKND
jgi:hypothetical protein